jgi:hypothetical protein
MKLSPVFAALLFAASAQAQQVHSQCSHGGSTQVGNQGNFAGGGFEGGGASINSGGPGLSYEPPRTYVLGYAKNDGEFVPSTYMNYEDALALGKQQLAAGESSYQVKNNVSLGEIARMYRHVKTVNLEARLRQEPSSRSRTPKAVMAVKAPGAQPLGSTSARRQVAPQLPYSP